MPVDEASLTRFKEIIREKNRKFGLAVGALAFVLGIAGLVWCSRVFHDQSDSLVYSIVFNISCAMIPVNILSLIYFLWTLPELGESDDAVERVALLRRGIVDVHGHRPSFAEAFIKAHKIDMMVTNVSSLIDDFDKLEATRDIKKIRILALDPHSDFVKYRYAELHIGSPEALTAECITGLRTLCSRILQLRLRGHDVRLFVFCGLPSMQYFRFDDRTYIGLLTMGGRSRSRITMEFDSGGACRSDYCIRFRQLLEHYEACLQSIVTTEIDVDSTVRAQHPEIKMLGVDQTCPATVRAMTPSLDTWTKHELLNRVTWRVKPEFLRPGRTARFVRGSRAFKLKGVGLYNPSSADIYCGVRSVKEFGPQPPIEREYEHRTMASHVGINELGLLVIKQGESSPIGGMFESRARAEFENAVLLEANSVPAVKPVMWGIYDNIKLHKQSFGFVCSSVDDDYAFNLESIAEYPFYKYPNVSDYFNSVASKLHVLGDGIDSSQHRFAVVSALYKQIGERMRGFSLAGLYRHSGGVNNYFFSRNQGTVLLWDLDSSRKLSEVSDHLRWLEVLRDICSCYHKIYHRLFPVLGRRCITVDEFINANIETSLLSAYFEVNAARVKMVVKMTRSLVVDDFHRAYDGQADLAEDCRSISRLEFYAKLFVALYDLYAESDLGRKFRPNVDKKSLCSMLFPGKDINTVLRDLA